MIHLYDLSYKGCISCFACKLKHGKSYGKCAVKDELTPILAKIDEADAILLGSPIYFFRMTGEMRSFMERLLFPYLEYADPWRSLSTRKINTGLIYTMNITEKEWQAMVADLKETMNMFHIPKKEHKELLAIVETKKQDVLKSDK